MILIGDDIEKFAQKFSDTKRLYNIREEVKANLSPFGHNFEALAHFKAKCSDRDKYFIYEVNNRALNDQPSYIFKSSVPMARLAVLMDRDGEGVLREEYAYIDATHDRCKGFKSVTLWTYHPVCRKLIRLAIMEIEIENAENLTLFWTVFNKMLQEMSGNSCDKFNPIGFVADEHHANWISIKNYFGEETISRVVSCEFHYKQSVRRQAKKLSTSASEFITLADELLDALSESAFEIASYQMTLFITNHKEIDDWFNWWYSRRTHVFRAFKPIDAPASNLAEVGHAKLSTVGRRYMSILEAAREDVATAIRQNVELQNFASGVSKGGRGPTLQIKQARAHRAQMKKAAAYANELKMHTFPMKKATIFVQKKGKHRPPENRKVIIKSCKLYNK